VVLKEPEMSRFEENLDCAPFSAVICRVAYRLVVVDYRQQPESYDDPANGLYFLAVKLDRHGFNALSMWIAAFAYKMRTEGLTLREARDEVIYRATEAERRRRGGRPWARVPKSCPRVTNRGAAFSPTKSLADSGSGDPQ
jgi:hypothetical protein